MMARIPGRAKQGIGSYCTGKCLKYDLTRKRGESIYKRAVRCTHCNSYIPRDSLIKVSEYKKWMCPCCHHNWLKGVYMIGCPPPPQTIKTKVKQ